MFKLSPQPFDINPYLSTLRDPGAGAFVCFEGWVRDQHQGREVSALEYEAWEPACQTQAQAIFEEARQRFGVLHVVALHRIGRLCVGDMAVWIGVTAAHRAEAFQACRYIIDELKKRLPIWKKEIYGDGTFQWVNGDTCLPAPVSLKNPTAIDEGDYYARQMILPEWGLSGQKTLGQASVLVVGAGGLGCAALTSLAQAGVGTIKICEFDTLSVSNLHRQSLYECADIASPKVELAAQRLRSINPLIRVQMFPQKLDCGNFKDIICDVDVILDCSDNFATKFLLNDIAVLYQKALVQAAIYQFEGQVRGYFPGSSGACLRCLWPQMPPAGCVNNCVDAGVIGVVPNIVGHLQAWEAVKWILNFPDRLEQDMLTLDLRTYQVTKIRVASSPDCPICATNPKIQKVEPSLYSAGGAMNPDCVDIDRFTKDELKQFQFIDIREADERRAHPVDSVDSVHLPYSDFGNWKFQFDPQRQYLLFCGHGLRSMNCVYRLRQDNILNVRSVNDGAEAIQRFFDSVT